MVLHHFIPYWLHYEFGSVDFDQPGAATLERRNSAFVRQMQEIFWVIMAEKLKSHFNGNQTTDMMTL